MLHPAQPDRGEIFLRAKAIDWPSDGTEYIDTIMVNTARFNSAATNCGCLDNSISMGINLQLMPVLLKQLPRSRHFSCNQCCGSKNNTEAVLPAGLPDAAAQLEHLELRAVGIGGTLPVDWGNWTSINYIHLDHNCIHGSLPASFSGMATLADLTLADNLLTGTLPAAWGERKLMSPMLKMDLQGTRVYSTILHSWSHFKHGTVLVDSAASQSYGCVPAGTYLVGFHDCSPGTCPKFPDCSSLSAEAVVLMQLKAMLQHNGGAYLQGLLDTWVNTTGKPCMQLSIHTTSSRSLVYCVCHSSKLSS
jgi:hypothetical protein